MVLFFISFILAFFVTLFATPAVARLAVKAGAVDHPNERKIHDRIIPRLGGVAIYFGFAAAIIFGSAAASNAGMKIGYHNIWGILIGATMILILGIADDVKGLNPRTKFFWQFAAALTVYFFGVGISFFSTPFKEPFALPVFLGLPLTLFWIVGITNAINLIDGLDGLSTGVTAISAATFLIVSLNTHQFGAALVVAALLGASLGFLKHNFYPAKIFPGDSGSLLLGFLLASASIIGVFKTTLVVALIIPLLILGVPIFDTLFAIGRRMKNRHPLFKADNKHIHHMLLRAGFSQREAVMSIYIVCFLLSITAIVMALYR